MRVGKGDGIVRVGVDHFERIVILLDAPRNVVHARHVRIVHGIQIRGESQGAGEILVEPVPLSEHLCRPLMVTELRQLVGLDLPSHVPFVFT